MACHSYNRIDGYRSQMKFLTCKIKQLKPLFGCFVIICKILDGALLWVACFQIHFAENNWSLVQNFNFAKYIYVDKISKFVYTIKISHHRFGHC